MQELNVWRPGQFIYGLGYGIVSIFIFFLLWEWLRPLFVMSHMTDLYIIQPFLIAIGSFLVIGHAKFPNWIAWPLKLLVCVFIVSYFFNHGSLLDVEWWVQYIDITLRDGVYLLQGNFSLISSENRTLLFLFGWSLIIFAIQSILFYRHSSVWFVSATLIYLLFLQFFVGMDTTAGIIRSLGIGLLLSSLLNGLKIQKNHMDFSWSSIWLWIVFSILLVSGSVISGVYFSKSQAKEIQPIRWSMLDDLEIWSALSSDLQKDSAGLAKSGYGSDDSKLGGGNVLDNEIVFFAKTNVLTYWRGEAKSYYDGKGWTQPATHSVGYNHGLLEAYAQASSTNNTVQELLFNQPSSDAVIFAGGTISKFHGILTEDGEKLSNHQVMVDTLSGKYTLRSNQKLLYYKIEAQISTGSIYEKEEHLENDLQLPEQLPGRIKALAEQVVGIETNPYEKATRIKEFLQNNYEYNLDKPGYPKEDQDFVDHFLFEQKLGYCDHFSTAMVVMLRSLDIPARWVKGFTPGEVKLADASYSVVVRNKDAHSWVEAYFPERGWVTFDPTPNTHLNSSSQLASNGDGQANSDYSIWDEIKSKVASLAGSMKEIDLRFALMAFALVCLVVLPLWIKRKELLLWRLMRRIESAKRSEPLHSMFDRMWFIIFLRFGDIQSSQTIREYVEGLELRDENQRLALVTFAKMYESARYNHSQQPWMSKQDVLRLWRGIVS